jgi:hypothetical protein
MSVKPEAPKPSGHNEDASKQSRPSKPKREFGALRGKARVTSDFFEPLPEADLKAWE